ncbi:MAG: FGGY-family carbohydrate kinase [Paracoccaceae bacterium]|nr:FGGY-family carbohydrate kinase [Paracoccaceae bacterium]MDE2912958.1 FGGY-family carbohydrate kinase [Paracoccaceae bacterium]
MSSLHPKRVAVIDIGKSNVKFTVVGLSDLREIEVRTRPNRVRPGPPWAHFDVVEHWRFILESLEDCHRQYGIDAIAVATHGAAVVLLDEHGELAAPVLDYEDPGPDETADAYGQLRPSFEETGSPRLGGGQNVGAQIFWQFETEPGLRDRTAVIVTFPQFWSYMLTGVHATDVTSLGAHTDLWNPHAGCFSSLVDRLEIRDRIAPVHLPGDVLGPVSPGIRVRTGLPESVPVHCGIHDSNASLLPHILTRPAPFSVVSTGTWIITMSVNLIPATLDPSRDTLINVDAFGRPVSSARFMGGREYETVVGTSTEAPDAQTSAAAQSRHTGESPEVLDQPIMLLPAVVPEVGPFQGMTSRWVGKEPAPGSRQRETAASYYLALVTMHCLTLVEHDGDIVIEGPLARNRSFLDMLAAGTGSPVFVSEGSTGTSAGAALLATPGAEPMIRTVPHQVPIEQKQRLRDYANRWRQLVSRGP